VAELTATASAGPALASPGARSGALARLVLRRLASALLVLWLAATVTFLALRMVPCDPVLAILGTSGASPSPQVVAATRASYGLDAPLVVQYARYLGHLAGGDLGESYSLHRSVAGVVGEQVGHTLVLALSALLLAWVLATASTLLTCRRGRLAGAAGTALEVVAAALPEFWLGILLLVVLGFWLGLFPVSGGTGPAALFLPALTMAVPLAGFLAQVMRQSFEDALDQPFVLSARSRGMGDWAVRVRHVLRHAVLPGITLSGWAVGSLFSGAVVVESIYARPGLGTTLLRAVLARDLPLVLGVVLLIAAVYVVVNLAVDALYLVVDPRLRRA
jgi:peptide/nickel transport system permease protein